MNDIPQALAAARRLHQAGDLVQAEQHYRQILQIAPGNAEVWCLLGAACAGLERADEAQANYRQALTLQPAFAGAHNNLGVLFAQQGRREEARACFAEALRCQPSFVEAHNNLGNTLRDLGRLSEAMASYREALRLRPAFAEAHNNLGVVLMAAGDRPAAAGHLKEAVRLQPNSAEAHNNLGNLLRDQSEHDQAVACYRNALRLRPGYVEAHVNLGNALREQGSLDQAEAVYGDALRLQPGHPEAANNLGLMREAQGRLDDAVACYRDALTHEPNSAQALNNLGVALLALGQLDEALASFDEAIWLQPDYANAHTNRAMAWLLQGDFEQGWPEYEWRMRCPEFPVRSFAQPAWDGSPLAGRTILLHAEQGIGDCLQFIRYAAVLQSQGAKVLLECQPGLVRLLQTCPGIDGLIARGSPLPPCDVQAPLLSLPALCRTTLATIPDMVPYLAAEPERIEHWSSRLRAVAEFKIGIAWQGTPTYREDRWRSAPLAVFEPLARLPGVRLVSLQKNAGTEQLPAFTERFPVLDLGPELDETDIFVDTAAVLQHLDLLVTTDSAIAHLAGALGVRVCVALGDAPNFRWLQERADSPWYPTMRLFRQRVLGVWDEVFQQIADIVVGVQARRGAILVETSPGELLDRLTILEIRHARLPEGPKRQAVADQLAHLRAVRERLPASAELERLTNELRALNLQLWNIENELRTCEMQSDFGPRFVNLARSVYRWNDQRAALKRRIDDLLHSPIREEKLYDAER